MTHKKPIQKMKASAIGLLMLFSTSAFAQGSAAPPVICLNENQTSLNLRNHPTMLNIIQMIETQAVNGSRGKAETEFEPHVIYLYSSKHICF